MSTNRTAGVNGVAAQPVAAAETLDGCQDVALEFLAPLEVALRAERFEEFAHERADRRVARGGCDPGPPVHLVFK